MRPPKDPLESLAVVRGHRVDHAAGELAMAVRRREAADRARRDAAARREEHAARSRHIRDAEREALASGALRAGDLARAHAWEARVVAEDASLAADLAQARSEVAGAIAREEQARSALATRDAEARVVARARALGEQAERRRAEAKEEEASVEACRPRDP